MATNVDATGTELRAIQELTDLRNARVLEIGAGDGRLTFRYAAKPVSVVGLDLKEVDIRRAVRNCRSEFLGKVGFLCASAAALPFPAGRFDIAIFASSL